MFSPYQNILQNLEPDITFSYLGDFSGERDAFGIKINQVEYGNEIASENCFGTKIVVDCSIVENSLQIVASYNSSVCSIAQIKLLLHSFHADLEEIILFCLNSEKTQNTASDFGELVWSYNQFKKVENKIELGCSIESIYPLTPMQEGMLYHKLLNANSTE